jgi:hypothetical protein
MTTELTTEEKISIIDTHLKTIAFSKYNLELNLLEENAKTTPDSDILTRTNANLELLSNQIAALEAEKNSLN